MNLKVAGSVPESIFGFFRWHNPSVRTMTLGSTQPLTEISTRNISWRVKAAGAYSWQPYHLHVPTVLKYGNPNLVEPSGPVQTCRGTAFPLPLLYNGTQRYIYARSTYSVSHPKQENHESKTNQLTSIKENRCRKFLILSQVLQHKQRNTTDYNTQLHVQEFCILYIV